MNIKEIRECLPRSEKEQLLNLSYRFGERYGIFVLLEQCDGGIFLWEIYKDTEDHPERIRFVKPARTNRESLKGNLTRSTSPFIRSLRLGNLLLPVSSASGSNIGDECNRQEKICLISMLLKGAMLGELEEEPLSSLKINRYRLNLNEFPEITPESRLDASILFPVQNIPVRVNRRLKLSVGVYKKPRIIKISREEEVTVYIHGIKLYDVWQEAETAFQDKQYAERFTQKELAQMKKQYLAMLPGVCPQGYMIPLIEYECDKDYQIQFYSSEYLRKKPENKGTFLLVNFKSDTEYGPMGFKKRVCQLEAVRNGYEGCFAAELFLYYRQIPEKTVVCDIL